MHIRRTIIAPALLTIGAVGSVIAGPVIALTSAAAPGATAVASSTISPDASGVHM